MKIQELMMNQLGCLSWEQVTEKYLITSSYKALSEYFIAFKDWVSIFLLLNNLWLAIPCMYYNIVYVSYFLETMSKQEAWWNKGYTWLSNILSCSSWKGQKREGSTLGKSVWGGRRRHLQEVQPQKIHHRRSDMIQKLPKKEYMLMVADIPYGFRMARSIYDEEPFRSKQLEKMVKDFAHLTIASLWIIL